jgi:hypothetical protein
VATKDVKPILAQTVKESTMLMFIISMSLCSTVMSYLHISQSAAQASSRCGYQMVPVGHNPVDGRDLGFFLPPVSIILMTAPIIPAAAQDRRLRPDLVRRADDRDGDGTDPSAGRAQHIRHQNIAPDIPLRDVVWERAAVRRSDVRRDRADLSLPGHRQRFPDWVMGKK